jgi:MoxR-like ATPase
MAQILTYTGNFLQKRHEILQLDAYHPSTELAEAVNLALLLELPLLLMGEPGCGKTRLAEAVAAELHGDDWKKHYFRWDIKSASKAKDGIYYYDALRRLYDAHDKNADAKSAQHYIHYGALADALMKPQNGTKPNILLIDEIDKADLDFPNDLLLEIEKGTFFIPETQQNVQGKSKILVFITSNRERELPPAFLRRCLYHYIPFPDARALKNILMAKFSRVEDDILVEKAVQLFNAVRTKVDDQFGMDKKPATSELIEWFKVIDHYDLLKLQNNIQPREKAFLERIETFSATNKGRLKIPFKQVLLKTFESNQLFES